ncbi:MAG: twin-arginine translocase subunit TatC [Bacillota bacterium]
MDEKSMSIVEHLGEFRRVLVISFLSIVVASFTSYFLWGEKLLDLAIDPLKGYDLSLVFITIPEAFVTRVKISVVAGVVVASPIVLWQIWSYIVPALHKNERRTLLTLFPASLVLFAGGIMFAYFVVFRFAANFLLLVAGEDLTAMISISRYISFLLAFLLPFGIIFQLPLVVLFLTKVGVLSPAALIKHRKMVIVASFVIGAILSPPDVISQILMATVLLGLYEISILVSRLVKPKKVDYEDDLKDKDQVDE